jgi:hypothetical protein
LGGFRSFADGRPVVEAGLVIERFGEPRVSVEEAKAELALEDTLVAPLFLHIRALKPRANALLRTNRFSQA